jgi:hypothetical protein
VLLSRDGPQGTFSKELWRAHVLANLPFYCLLLPLFLDITRSRVSFRSDESLEDLRKVGRAPAQPLVASDSGFVMLRNGLGLQRGEAPASHMG